MINRKAPEFAMLPSYSPPKFYLMDQHLGPTKIPLPSLSAFIFVIPWKCEIAFRNRSNAPLKRDTNPWHRVVQFSRVDALKGTLNSSLPAVNF
jgi:hypothetical protein